MVQKKAWTFLITAGFTGAQDRRRDSTGIEDRFDSAGHTLLSPVRSPNDKQAAEFRRSEYFAISLAGTGRFRLQRLSATVARSASSSVTTINTTIPFLKS